MKKLFLISMLALLGVCVFAQNLKLIDLGGEGESYLFFNDEELYLVLPYVGEYAKLDRKALNYDKDGFLKSTFCVEFFLDLILSHNLIGTDTTHKVFGLLYRIVIRLPDRDGRFRSQSVRAAMIS